MKSCRVINLQMRTATGYFFFLLLSFSFPVFAQDKNAALRDSAQFKPNKADMTIFKDSGLVKPAAADSTAPTPSHLQLNLTWQSNDVNNGRKDSTVIPLITPEVSFIFKSGFEIDLSVGYNTHEPSPQVNQYTIDGSYNFNPGNYSGTVTLSEFWYSNHSRSTTAESKGSLEYASTYTLPFIQPGVNFTWTWGSHIPDYAAAFILQQPINIGNLSITPTVTMNVATQNAYNSYYQNRKFSIPLPGQTPLPVDVSISGEVLNAAKFQILDYEFSAPVSYTAKKWTFDFTPTYAVPVNPADIRLAVTKNATTKNFYYKEHLPNTFYVSFEVTYDF